MCQRKYACYKVITNDTRGVFGGHDGDSSQLWFLLIIYNIHKSYNKTTFKTYSCTFLLSFLKHYKTLLYRTYTTLHLQVNKLKQNVRHLYNYNKHSYI